MASHRKLVAWSEARASALAIHRYADECWRPQRSAALDQLRRASLSVVLNIAEGSSYGPGPRCRFHMRVAHGSAMETSELLDFLIALDEPVAALVPRATMVVGLTFGLVKHTRR